MKFFRTIDHKITKVHGVKTTTVYCVKPQKTPNRTQWPFVCAFIRIPTTMHSVSITSRYWEAYSKSLGVRVFTGTSATIRNVIRRNHMQRLTNPTSFNDQWRGTTITWSLRSVLHVCVIVPVYDTTWHHISEDAIQFTAASTTSHTIHNTSFTPDFCNSAPKCRNSKPGRKQNALSSQTSG